MPSTKPNADIVSAHIAARDATNALHNLKSHLIAAAPAEARADVQRLVREAEHNLACALAAAGIHPRAHTVEEPSRHGASIAQTNAPQESA